MPLPFTREAPRMVPAEAPPPPEPGFWEQATAAARVASDETDDAQRARIDSAYRDLAEALKERGYSEKDLSREAKWYRLEPGFRVDYDKVKAAVDRERQRDPSAFKQIGPDWVQFERNVRARNGGRAADQSVMARGTGVSSVVAGIMGATASDVDNGPLGPLTFMVGGGGKSALWRILGEGVVNAAQEVVVTPERMRAREVLGEPMTATDAAIGVGEAFAGGVLFAGVGEGFSRFVLPKSQAAFEKVVANNWDRLPEGLRTRWEARATLDPTQADVLLADVSEAVIGPERLTEAQADALAVIRREAQIDTTNPFVPNGAGETAHLDAIAQTVARIMADEPAQKPAFVPPAGGGALPAPAPGAPRIGTAMATGTVAGDAPARFMQRVRAAESSGNDLAAATGSSAFGRYQFTKGTWISYFTKRFGTMGLTREQILAKRADGRLQDLLMGDLTADNAAALRRIGAPVTEGNLYLAHFLGPKDAEKVLRASPDTPLQGLISSDAIAANPKVLGGKSAGDVIAFADRKMGSAGSAGGGVHLRPDAGVEPGLRAQIDTELAQLRAETARIEADMRAEGVDVDAEIARQMDGELAPIDMPEVLLAAPERPRPADAPPPEIEAILPPLRAVVADKGRKLNDFEAIAAEIGATPEEVRKGLLELVKDKGGGLAIRRKDNAFIRRAPAFGKKAASGPEDVLEFIARNGGIRDDEGHALGLKGLSKKQADAMISDATRRRAEMARQGGDRGWKTMTRYNGPLLRHEGRSVDQVGELLWEAGYLTGQDGGRPTTADVLDYLDQRIADGRARYTMADQAQAADTAPGADWMAEVDAMDMAMSEIELAAINGFEIMPRELDSEFLSYAARLRQQNPDLTPEQAFIDAVNDYAFATQLDAMDESGNLRYEDVSYEDYYGPSGENRPDAGNPDGPAGIGADTPPGVGFASTARSGEEAGRLPLEELPREEAGRFIDPDGKAAKAQSDALEHDARMALDAYWQDYLKPATGIEAAKHHNLPEADQAEFAKGWEAGRSGEPKPADTDTTFYEGWHVGDVTRQKLGDRPSTSALDNGAAVDPAIAARQRAEAQLRAEAPLRGANRTGQAQDGTMGLGLFDQADVPKFDLGDGDGPTDLKGLFDKLDGEADDLGTIRSCMVPKPKGDA